MLRKLILTGLTVLGLLCLPLSAKTILTEANVERYLAMLSEMNALEDRFPDNHNLDIKLESHCDWPKHYQMLKSTDLSDDYIQQMEALIRQHGFQPAEFLELSFKVSWPMLEMTRPIMEMSQQMLEHLPADRRAEQEAEMAEAMQLISLLERCMTDADKKAAQGLQHQLLKQAFELDDNEMDMEHLQQMMELMQQN